jgi:hypothetical protein
MIDSSLLQLIENWGYYLLPKDHASAPGYPGLLVALREQPTEMHFDPEYIELRFSDQEDSKWTALRLGTPIHGIRRVMAGRILVSDRLEKGVPFFSFGATLTASYGACEVIYAIRSPAPILQIDENNATAANQLSVEAQVLMGRWQAQHGRKEGISHLMDGLDACTFYQICLQRLMKRYARQPGMRGASHRTYVTLQEECEWLKMSGQWQTVDTLDLIGLVKH